MPLVIATCSLSLSDTSSGQLIWGPGGTGGAGTWETVTANWWNGSANVPWTNSGVGVFSGTAGAITVGNNGVTAAGLVFDVPGYSIQSGRITSSGTGLSITANAPATISSTLSGSSLLKNGPAALTVAGTNFFTTVQVQAGEFIVGEASSLFFSNVTLGDGPGVILTMAPTPFTSTSIRSLSGGGILQPNDQARTVKVNLFDSGNFHGSARDNGSGKLAIELFASSGTITFGGPNTYSGPTSVGLGTLVFSENGSALNTSFKISREGVLRLDNTANALANRVSDTAEVTMESGVIELVGHATMPVTEQLGPLKFFGAANLGAVQPGTAATVLSFAGATRTGHATINFTGNGKVGWTGIANGGAGIVGAYATAGNEWATVGGDGRVSALTTYATDLNLAGAGDHVKLIGDSTVTLTNSATRSTLNLQNNGPGTSLLSLGDKVLTLSEGGILSSGTSTARIQGGTLLTGASELVVTNHNNLTIDSNIAEVSAGAFLVKTGAGTLTLAGQNTYSGMTVINQGILAVGSDANVGTGDAIQFGGGTLKATQSFTSSKKITRSTSYVASIDTAGFNVTFTGVNDWLSKSGAGVLTLTYPLVESVSVNQGTLRLPNALTGDIALFGGTLQAAGALSSLDVNLSSTLDIGGPGAALLNVGTYLPQNLPLTVRFDLGATAQDLWAISDSFGFSSATKTILFDFQNLGGVTTGTNYTLIDLPSFSFPSANLFGFAPAATAAGWAGNFSVSPGEVRVNFTSTPEPGAAALCAAGLALFSSRRRRRCS